MPLPEGFGEATWVFELNGDAQPMTFSMGFTATDTSAGGLGAAFGELVAEFSLNIITGAADVLTGWTWRRVEMRANPVGSAEIEGAVALNISGSNVGSSIPINGAVLVRKSTGLAGRENRGRFFMPPFGLDESDVDQAGYIDSAAVATTQTKVDDWLTAFEASTAGNEMVLFHSDPLLAPTVITAFEVDNRIATQRRRLR